MYYQILYINFIVNEIYIYSYYVIMDILELYARWLIVYSVDTLGLVFYWLILGLLVNKYSFYTNKIFIK